MKVQKIDTEHGPRYLLLDDDYLVVDPVKRYLKHVDACGKSPNTIRAYAYDLLSYFEFLKMVNISFLDLCSIADKGPVDILSDFVLWLQYPLVHSGIYQLCGEVPARSPKTVNHIVGTVLDFYKYLAANKELEELDVFRSIRRNPKFQGFLGEMLNRRTKIASSVFRRPEPDKKVEGITREQFRQLLAECRTRRDRVLLEILYEGGTRLGEALGIKLEDICDLSTGEISLRSRENVNEARVKRHADREIYLPGYVMKEIVDYITEDLSDSNSDFLFVNLSGPNCGKAMASSGVEALFRRLSRRVGFKVHPHMLRHGFAMEKLDADWDMVDIKAFLGHKSIISTDIYAEYTNEKKRKMIERFQNERSERLQNYLEFKS